MGNKKVPKSPMIALFSKLLGINSCWQNRIEFEKKIEIDKRSIRKTENLIV